MAESSQPGIEWVLSGECSLCQRQPCTERLCEQKDMRSLEITGGEKRDAWSRREERLKGAEGWRGAEVSG